MSLLLVGCGGDGDDGGGSSSGGSSDIAKTGDGGAAALSEATKADPPDHNPDAVYNGKGVLEYAKSLNDLNPAVQIKALKDINAFGVDGLPARDQVLALVDGNAEPSVKVIALNVLHDMKAPEAEALVRQKLADPNFAEADDIYRSLLRGLKDMEVDEATLRADLMKIHKDNPEHAIRLMKMGSLPASVRNPLSKVVFESDHDAATTQFFMQNLMALDFLTDEQRLAYIQAHPAEASKQIRSIQGFLLKIGTQDAMKAMLELKGRQGQLWPKDRYNVMVQFATQGSVEPKSVMDTILADAKAAESQQLIDEALSYMDLLVRQVVQTEKAAVNQQISQDLFDKKIDPATATTKRHALNKEPAGPKSEAATATYTEAMNDLIANGPTDTHKALGVLRLVRMTTATIGMKAAALAPAFDALTNTSAAEIIRGTAQKELPNAARGMLTRDPEGLVTTAIAAMWKCEDAIAAQAFNQIFNQSWRYPGMSEKVVEEISKGVDDHLDSWGVNPAAEVLMLIGGNTNNTGKPVKTAASVAYGKVTASKKADAQYLQRSLNSGRNRIMGGNNTEAMIAILKPTVDAAHETIHEKFYPGQFASYMSIVQYFPSDYRTDPEAAKQWIEFLKYVAAKNHKVWSPAAQKGLKASGK